MNHLTSQERKMVVVQGFLIKAMCYLNSPCGTILHQKTIFLNEKNQGSFLQKKLENEP